MILFFFPSSDDCDSRLDPMVRVRTWRPMTPASDRRDQTDVAGRGSVFLHSISLLGSVVYLGSAVFNLAFSSKKRHLCRLNRNLGRTRAMSDSVIADCCGACFGICCEFVLGACTCTIRAREPSLILLTFIDSRPVGTCDRFFHHQ